MVFRIRELQREKKGRLAILKPSPKPESSFAQEAQETSPPPVHIAQTSLLLTLPLELIQEISSYLPEHTLASFSLTSRYTYYAIGTASLSTYLRAPFSKPQRRLRIETLERAFPSHWYCAWCDRFHAHEKQGGPKKLKEEPRRDCAEFSSYLHDGWGYVLAYHHVRMAVNRALWGEEYGIGVEECGYEREVTVKVGGGMVDTKVQCEAKVVGGSFLLHASYKMTVPVSNKLLQKGLGAEVWGMIPHVVIGHRDNNGGHTGLRKTLENAVARLGYEQVQLCSLCATDYVISCTTNFLPPSASSTSSLLAPSHHTPHRTMQISTFRDLGSGRSPFDAQWRAHGYLGNGRAGYTSDVLRLTGLQPGEIKKAFESGGTLRHVPGSTGLMLREGVRGKSFKDRNFGTSWTDEIIRSRAKRVAMS